MTDTNKTKVLLTAHTNNMGDVSYDLSSPVNTLRMFAASSFFGETKFYGEKQQSPRVNSASNISRSEYLFEVLKGTISFEDNETVADATARIIDAAIEHDLEGTLQLAVELRHDHNIRTMPQVIAVRAANHVSSKGTGLVRKYNKDILSRGDEPAVQMAYQLTAYGRKIPSQLKRSWKDYLEGLSANYLAKYRCENSFVKTIDVVRMCHASSDAINQLVDGSLTLSGSTWESYISENGSNTENWKHVMPKMGHMALLRNMRNLGNNGIAAKEYATQLKDGVIGGKQMPFRYYSAYQNVTGVNEKQLLEECMDISVDNLPKFEGHVVSMCDNSGSAHGSFTSSYGNVKVSNIANLTAVITGKLGDTGDVVVFGDKHEIIPVDKTKGVLKQAKNVDARGSKQGMGTEHGIWSYLREAIDNKYPIDHLFVYSDMQAGHGGLYGINVAKDDLWEDRGYGGRHIDVPKMIAEYREKVNPDVQVYLVQVAGYTDTLVPEYYDKTYILSGWSDGIFKFAKAMSKK